MVKKKKEEFSVGVSDFSEHIRELQDKLKIANICNQLIKAKNPFSVEIDDSELLEDLSKELRTILHNKINGINNTENVIDENNSSDLISSDSLTPNDLFIIKEFVGRINNKKNGQKLLVPNRPTNSLPKAKKSTKEVYFEDGEILYLAGNSIFIKEDDEKEVLQAGAEVSFINDLGGGKIRVINMESGEEGIVEAAKVKKQL